MSLPPPKFLSCPFAFLFVHIFHEGESDKTGRLSRGLGKSQVGPSPGHVFETDKVTDGMTEGSGDRREPLIHPGETRARRDDI